MNQPEVAVASGRQQLPAEESVDPTTADLETIILQLVQQDPFATIMEMKRAANRFSKVAPVSWWEVFSLLRKRRLLSRRSRFRLIRRQL
ncbi:MAG: hypothetical protein ABII79_11510 [bacterium]